LVSVEIGISGVTLLTLYLLVQGMTRIKQMMD
jgi:hypothetical protein